MKKQVEEFIGDLLTIGFSRDSMSQKAYDYALSLQTDQLADDVRYVPSFMMARAASLVRESLPGGYRIHELRSRIR